MSSRPRIFHLITRLVDGGAVSIVMSIVTDIDRFDVTVGFGAEADQHNVHSLREEGIRTKQFPLIRHYNPVTAVGAVYTVARYLMKHDFDIVHTHSTEAGIIGRAAAQLAGVSNVVHTIHGVPFTEDRTTLLNWFVKRCEQTVAPWTDEMVSIADVITQEYLSHDIGQPEQYRTIMNGIETDTFRTATPADDLPGSGVRALMVSRLAPGKGFEVLIEAIDQLGSDNLSVLIAGDGPLQAKLETEIQSRNLDRTAFLLGYRDDVPSLMAGCDFLVLPSFREGTPLVIMEAMAAGLPVIATDIAGIPELVDSGETGILIEPGDDVALATEMERLVAFSELRRELGGQGQRKASHFSVDRMVSEYSEMYDQLLSGDN